MQIAFRSVAPRLSLKASNVPLLSLFKATPETKVLAGQAVSSYAVQSPSIPLCGEMFLKNFKKHRFVNMALTFYDRSMNNSQTK